MMSELVARITTRSSIIDPRWIVFAILVIELIEYLSPSRIVSEGPVCVLARQYTNNTLQARCGASERA